MAFADANNITHASVLEMEPDEGTSCARVRHCNAAIEALGRALKAIACDDIEGRCFAVTTATEATTAFFLELDSARQGQLGQSPNRLYESILARLIVVNLRNEANEARAAISMIERLRDACTPPSGEPWPQAEIAIQSEP